MKIVAFILSILILVMSVKPCSDGSIVTSSESIEYSGCHHDSSDRHGDDEDGCSPFCVCQCCGITLIMPEFRPSYEVLDDFHFGYSFLYSFDYSFDYTTGVWHPPA